MKFSLRLLYLYLFSFVGLIIVVFGSINIVNLGIRTFIFKDADRYEIYPPSVKMPGEEQLSKQEMQSRADKDLKRQRERQLTDAIAMIVVGVPLYTYHWRTIQRENAKVVTPKKSESK